MFCDLPLVLFLYLEAGGVLCLIPVPAALGVVCDFLDPLPVSHSAFEHLGAYWSII